MIETKYDYSLNDIKNAEKEVLKTFHDICTTFNLPYSIMAGTLLGAIRHNGFIPWDDDIDVGMPRDAFMYLCKNWERLVPPGYFLQYVFSENGFNLSFARLRKYGTCLMNGQTKDSFMHQGVFIDIFPHDYCSSFKKADKVKKKKGKLESLIARKVNPWGSLIFESNIPNKGLKTIIAKLFNVNFLRKKLFNYYKSFHGNSFCVDINCKYGTKHGFFDKNLFDNLILVKFDELKVYAFSSYDSYLTITYGDYMKIPEHPESELHGYRMVKLD